MVTFHTAVIPYQGQEIDLETILLTGPQTVFRFGIIYTHSRVCVCVRLYEECVCHMHVRASSPMQFSPMCRFM